MRLSSGASAHWVRDGVLEIIFVGRVRGGLISGVTDQVRELVREAAPRAVIIDALDVVDYGSEVRGPGIELLRLLAAAGLREGIGVTRSASVRMIATAISHASGLPLRFVTTRQQALSELREVG